MKISIKKQNILKLLNKVQSIVERKNHMPILANVLLEAKEGFLFIYATNLEVSLIDKTVCKIEKEGKTVVNSKNLFEIIKELPDEEVILSKNETNNWLKIKQNKSNFDLVGLDVKKYPIFPSYNMKNTLKFSKNNFLEMLEKTFHSISNDETRYHLNGVFFSNRETEKSKDYVMVSTDGHRLSLVESLNENKEQVNLEGIIVPKKGLSEIKKIFDIEKEIENFKISIEKAQIVVSLNHTILIIRLIDGKFPDYNKFIPKKTKQKATINKEVFLSALKRVSLLSNQKSKNITIEFNKDTLKMNANNAEMGNAEEEIPIAYSGDNIVAGFNARFLIEALSTIKEEEILFYVKDKISPGLLTPIKNTKFKYVIMPMRI
ncbi:MAG: DNA polymerase III subunit beta [Bdellovibrionaceae bacterium]|nr:DNA polymerase III subunit beta [Pseudobdellovibrionaceae bacterium]